MEKRIMLIFINRNKKVLPLGKQNHKEYFS